MAIGNYLPTKEQERVAWLRNFINQFTLNAPIFNFTPDEIEGVRKDCTVFSDIIDAIMASKNRYGNRPGQRTFQIFNDTASSLSSISSAYTNIPAGIFRRLSFTIRKIKNHESYTESLGLALGIIGEETSLIHCMGNRAPEL